MPIVTKMINNCIDSEQTEMSYYLSTYNNYNYTGINRETLHMDCAGEHNIHWELRELYEDKYFELIYHNAFQVHVGTNPSLHNSTGEFAENAFASVNR